MSNAVFTLGSSTEQKMDMSLDSIIKQNKTSKKTPRGTVKRGGQKPAQKDPAVQRRQQMAAQARNRAVANRGNKVDKMRGVQTTAKQPTFKLTISTRDKNWVVQQRQRDQERKKKLQIYKKIATTGSTTSSGSIKNTNTKNVTDLSSFKISVPNPAFHFEAPTQSNNNSNRNNQRGSKNKGNKANGGNNGSIRISTGGSGRKAVVANRPERERDLPQRTVQFKGRKNEAVAKRRGIEATTESKQPASLSDRFGSVQTPQRENNTTRGRGGRGGRGNGRGASRGASGGSGGRDANIRIVRRT